MDTLPVNAANKYRFMVQQNKQLKRTSEKNQEGISHYKEQIKKLLSCEVPPAVKELMLEHDLPWEFFWCYEHEQWLTQFDNLIPYHTEDNKCDQCE